MTTEKFPTIKEIITSYLGDPPRYCGYPVDLSGLDTLINGYVIKKAIPKPS